MQRHPDRLRKQWEKVEELLEHWLQERKELLVLYCNYGKNGNQAVHGDPQPRWVDARRFCQILVDYVSAGHFEVYDQLVCEAQVANASTALAEALYPKIHETTQIALDLNDKYATEELWELHQADFPGDLSKLGEALSNRFEMEDRLISEMHSCNEPLMA